LVGFGKKRVDRSCHAADTGTLRMYTELTASPKKMEIQWHIKGFWVSWGKGTAY